MINKKQMNKEQALFAMENGEFDKELTASKSKVVVIMTQNWCPQWKDLKSWVYDIETDEDIDIYELEYNKVDYFDAFMNFKENKWKNHEIPYLRIYKDGTLVKETNHIGEQQFLEIMDL